MANIKSAKKRILVNQTKALQNQMVKSALKTVIKKFNAAVAAGDKAQTSELYRLAVKKIDQAVARGILHKNNAAHKKSEFTLKYNQLVGVAPVAPKKKAAPVETAIESKG